MGRRDVLAVFVFIAGAHDDECMKEGRVCRVVVDEFNQWRLEKLDCLPRLALPHRHQDLDTRL